MTGLLTAMDPMKVAMAIIALLGTIPVAVQYRDQAKWFAVGYALLVVAALATNLENLFLGDLLNLAEHGIGLMGAGLAFLAAAYVHRQRLTARGGIDDG
ncbi:hypothetical protein [Halosimplex sp. TS25]|uniref:hypothetical protein n=1 Tax=Halosimplex rarum TaxID=3396619 RepID=UPI0039E8E096